MRCDVPAVIVAAFVAGGCADTTGLESIDDLAVRDMAIVAADAAIEDLGSWGLEEHRGRPGGHAEHGGRPGGPFGPGAGDLGTIEESYFDVGGAEQAAFDQETTDRIESVTTVAGDVSRENWTATVDRTREMTFTGLYGAETHRTVNGSGASSISGSRHTDDGDRTYDMSGTFTFTDVLTPIPGSDPPWPISGTIHRTMHSTRTDASGSETRDMDMTITFDGDETAVVVVNGETMEIDLSAREGRRPMRGHFGG